MKTTVITELFEEMSFVIDYTNLTHDIYDKHKSRFTYTIDWFLVVIEGELLYKVVVKLFIYGDASNRKEEEKG